MYVSYLKLAPKKKNHEIKKQNKVQYETVKAKTSMIVTGTRRGTLMQHFQDYISYKVNFAMPVFYMGWQGGEVPNIPNLILC